MRRKILISKGHGGIQVGFFQTYRKIHFVISTSQCLAAPLDHSLFLWIVQSFIQISLRVGYLLFIGGEKNHKSSTAENWGGQTCVWTSAFIISAESLLSPSIKPTYKNIKEQIYVFIDQSNNLVKLYIGGCHANTRKLALICVCNNSRRYGTLYETDM